MKTHHRVEAGMWICCLPFLLAGCSVTSIYKKAIKLGVQAVGDTVQEAELDKRSEELIGRPPGAADAEFGARLDTLADTRSPRVLLVYPVKDDITNSFRWIVETEDDRIVALAKVIRNADIGKDQVKAFIMKERMQGKTVREIESKRQFQKLMLVLRRQSTGRIVRVYDVSGFTDIMEARYCLIEFDEAGRLTELRLVTVPAKTGRSTVGKK